MPQHGLLLLHASRASVDPVSEYYLHHAPELRPVNLLDEGVMGCLRAKEWGEALEGLLWHLRWAVDRYGVRAALVTCSALGPEAMAALRTASPVPVVKIDEPMLEAASREEGPAGLLATFPSTVETSLEWLHHYNPGLKVETICDAPALESLLRGERERHDELLIRSAEILARRPIARIVLAQVSMARLAAEIQKRTGLETVESLSTSLGKVRSMVS
jgi:glutamate racemase